MKNEVIIQFSGGIDSLYAAHYLADKFDKVHLLTFYKGYLQYAIKANEYNVKVLQKVHGNKIQLNVIDMRPLFKAMAVKTYRETSKKYGNETAWCLPCRASMGIMCIIYALENEIPKFTDGANWEQNPDSDEKKLLVTADNYPEFLELVTDFAKDLKVNYEPVVYELNTRNDRRDELVKIGAKIDFNSMDRKKKSLFDVFNPNFYKRTQPICLSGYLAHWKRNLFNVKENVTPEDVVNSTKPKMDTIGKEFVREYFKNKNLDLDEILAKRS